MSKTSVELPKAEIVAIIRYEEATYFTRLQFKDDWGIWLKTVSDMVPEPVEVVLHDKSYPEGITIIDERSFVEAQKVLEIVRSRGDVLRFQLYPIVSDSVEYEEPELVKCDGPGTLGQNLESTLRHGDKGVESVSFVQDSTRLAKVTEVADKMAVQFTDLENRLKGLAQEKVKLVAKLSEEDPDGQFLLNEVHTATNTDSGFERQDDKQCPLWAFEMKRDLSRLIEDKFLQLELNMERKLECIHRELSRAASQNTLFDRDNYSVVSDLVQRVDRTPSFSPVLSNQNRGPLESAMQESVSSLASSVPTWTGSLPSVSSNSGIVFSAASGRTPSLQQPQLTQFVPEVQQEHQTNLGGVQTPQSVELSSRASSPFLVLHGVQTVSDCGSVVMVSPPGSLMDVDNITVGKRSATDPDVEIVEMTPAGDEDGDTGSVVYVETDVESDMEDDEDGLSSLRSWAGETGSPASKMADSFATALPGSMQASYYSTISDIENPTAPEVSDDERDVGEEEQLVGKDASVEEVSVRPVPVSVSESLPVDLNAMQPIEEQDLFSPNSDIGTKLLSAASSIASGFIQSVEMLSKKMHDLETRLERRESERERRESVHSAVPAEDSHVLVMEEVSVPVSSVVQSDPVVEQIQRAVPVTIQDIISAVEDIPPPVPPRRTRQPPASTGPFMSDEEIKWYIAELGIPELHDMPWAQQTNLTREQFNYEVNLFYEGIWR